MSLVTNHIEQRDRRIVGVDEQDGSFVVYCPTADALSDLWAMCVRINEALVHTLLPGDQNPIITQFRLTNAHVRTVISGPEFLRYKNELVSNAH